MKKWIILLLVIIVLITSNTSCRKPDEQVLYVLSRNFDDELLSLKRTDGDGPIDIEVDGETFHAFDVKWDKNGCVLYYRDAERNDVSIHMHVGKTKNLEVYADPILFGYKVYLSPDEGRFPKSWNKDFESMLKKAQYGTFESFAESRHGLNELNIIKEAFDEANLEQNAEAWYTAYLESIWNHDDYEIRIVKASVEHKTDDIFITLYLTDDKRNEMILYGFINDYVDYIKYKGETYAGPFT